MDAGKLVGTVVVARIVGKVATKAMNSSKAKKTKTCKCKKIKKKKRR